MFNTLFRKTLLMQNFSHQSPSDRFDNKLPKSGEFTMMNVPSDATSLPCNTCQYSVKDRAGKLIWLRHEGEFQPICSLRVDENDLSEVMDLRNGWGDLRHVSQDMLVSTPQWHVCPDRKEDDWSREPVKIMWIQRNVVTEERALMQNYELI